MDVYGSNLSYGRERVEISQARSVLPVCEEGESFPLGVAGLIPVETLRKGKVKTSYAFPLGEDGLAEGSTCHAALSEAVGLVNSMLEQAYSFSGHGFGAVDGVQVGIPATGRGFTRVEIVALDAHGDPHPAPLHLHIETTDHPETDICLSGVVEYDRAGTPFRMTLTEYGARSMCRVTATKNPKTGRFSVYKVEESQGETFREGRLLYKRGQLRDGRQSSGHERVRSGGRPHDGKTGARCGAGGGRGDGCTGGRRFDRDGRSRDDRSDRRGGRG